MKDINLQYVATTRFSAPAAAAIGNVVFFPFDDNVNGVELWKTDGTAAGTVMLKNIYPGIASADPEMLTAFKEHVYFTADDGIHGRELWKTDGTESGTVLLKDVVPGEESFSSSAMYAADNLMYIFGLAPGSSGQQLWVSDGTTPGTRQVVSSSMPDIDPLLGKTMNDKFFFSVPTSVSGPELWVSDGTVLGTMKLLKISPTADGYNNFSLTVMGNSLYFFADGSDRGLWKSDGTPAGTVKVFGILSDRSIVSISSAQDRLYITTVVRLPGDVLNGIMPTAYTFLSVSDGTNSGINIAGSESASVGRISLVEGNSIYFWKNRAFEPELWKSDGTIAGTTLVKEFFSSSLGPGSFKKCNGTIYFRAYDPEHGYEIWRTDGTPTGTRLLKDITPGSAIIIMPAIVGATPDLFFLADDGENGMQPWRSDGTSSGTVPIGKIGTGTASASPKHITVYNNKLIFGAADGLAGHEVWTSDGTEAGTQLLSDILPGSVPFGPFYQRNGMSDLFFTSISGLWKTDGTQEGTVKIKNQGFEEIQGGIGSNIIFSSRSNGLYLWKSDGTIEGTVQVQKISGGRGLGPHGVNIGGTLFFSVQFEDDYALMKTDGTSAGTVMVKNGFDRQLGSQDNFTEFNDKLVFTAADNVAGREVWISDGTTAGTTILKDTNPGAAGSEPSDLVTVNGSLFFAAQDSETGSGLWKSDGTSQGTVRVKQMRLSAKSLPLHPIAVHKSLVYFSAEDAESGIELWKTDGTTATLAADVLPGPQSSDVEQIRSLNDTIFFFARGASGGLKELWISNGTGAATRMTDISTKISGFTTDQIVSFNNRYYVSAIAPGTGHELYSFTMGTMSITGLGEQALSDVSFFPNPSTGLFHLEGEFANDTRASIFDALGRLVAETTVQDHTIDLQYLPAGIYLIRLKGRVTQTARVAINYDYQ